MTIHTTGVMFLMAAALVGCSADSLVDVRTPSSILTPDAVQTYGGAVSMYNGGVAAFNYTFMGAGPTLLGPFTLASGALADEYTGAAPDDIDGRHNIETDPSGSGSYTFTSMARAALASTQAITYLHAYAPTAPKAYLARTYINRGYIAIFMSELYCSGVPTSDATSGGGVIYSIAVSRDSLQRYALAQFDSALVYAAQDTGFLIPAAKIGRARVYLGMKQYDKASAEVSHVPTNFHFDATYSSSVPGASNYFQPGGMFPWYSVSNKEGLHGLDFISANDPRVKVTLVSNINGIDIYQPVQWRASGSIAVPVETGIDARLIEAEYLLSQGNTTAWLASVNALRTTCTSAGPCATPAPAGSGGMSGLPPLTDPGTPSTRLQLTFRERGFWLFGTGHRQGDLRRLVRQYGLPQSQVYPTGTYINGTLYGVDTNITIGPTETTANPNYKGCIDRDA